MENVDTFENVASCMACEDGYILTGQGAQSGVRTPCKLCLGTGLDRIVKLNEKMQRVEASMQRIGFDPEEEWDLEELSMNLEPGDMVRIIFGIGEALRNG